MSANNKTNVLSEAFLEDLFYTCLADSYILSMVCQYVEEEHLPDRNTATILKAFKEYYLEYRRTPTYSIIQQKLAGKNGALRFWKGVNDNAEALIQMSAWAFWKNT